MPPIILSGSPSTVTTNRSGPSTNYLVEAANGSLYFICFNISGYLVYRKSSDGGMSWDADVVINAVSGGTLVSVWYDRWSGLSTDYIHVAATDSTNDDTIYRTINTASSDALSTMATVFNGGTTGAGGNLSICRARGGNVYIATMIDTGTEGGFYRLPNANVPNGAWDAARTTVYEGVGYDMCLLQPGFAADNQDMIAMYWDASDNEITRKLYDDSGNSWGESSIATSMAETTTTASCWAATTDLANSKVIFAAWSATDTANADLRCWTITESAITETSTNIILNSVDDQGIVSLSLNTATGKWTAYYAGKSDGSETFGTSVNLFSKYSLDAGATWSSERQLTPSARNFSVLFACPRTTREVALLSYYELTISNIAPLVLVEAPIKRATNILGF